MFSFDCRSRKERSLRLLQTRSRLQSGTGKEVGRKVTGHCLVCRWSASRRLVNGSPLADCTHCRHWNTVFKPAVDVAPRHHKCSSSQQDLVHLTRPTFRYISGKVPSSVSRALSCDAEVTSAAATGEETARRLRDPLALLSSQSEPHGKEFRVRFSKPNTLRERTTLAQDARNMFHTFPYTNPRPHDHRPLSATRPLVRTLRTPDPQLIRLRRDAISTSLHTDAGEESPAQTAAPAAGNVEQFITRKTPEPKYQQRLWHERGHYTPAFTAHEAYLARVANSISKRSTKGM